MLLDTLKQILRVKKIWSKTIIIYKTNKDRTTASVSVEVWVERLLNAVKNHMLASNVRQRCFFLGQRMEWKHITSPWGSRHWSRYSRKQKGTRWHLERRLSGGRGECGVWQLRPARREAVWQNSCQNQALTGRGALTLWTPKVPKGRGLLVFVSIRRTSASSIILWPPGKAWGM